MKFGRIIAAYHQFQDTAGRNASGGKLFVFDEPSQTVVPSVLYRESTHEILQNPLSIDDKGQVTDFVVDADKMYYVLVKDINGDEIYSRHNLTCLEGEGAEGRDYFPGDYISIHEDRTINVDPVRQLLVEAPLTLDEAEDSLTIGIDESQFADKTVVTGSDGITVTSTGNTYNVSGRELENKITIVDNKIEGFRDLVQAEQDRAESAEGALENWQAAHGKKLTITDGTNVTEFDGTEDKTVDISVAATKWEDTESGIKPKDDKNVEVTNLNASGSLTVNGVNVLNTSSSIETGRQYAITAGDGDGNVTLTEVQSGGSGLPPYSIDNIGQILKVTNDPTAEEPISARWVDLGEQDSSKWTADDFYSYLTPKSDWSTYSIKGKDFKTRDNYLTIDSDAITFTKPSKITNSFSGGSTVAFIANSPAATSGKQYGLTYDGAEGQYKLSEVVAPDLSEYAKKTDIPPSINAYSKDEADAKFQLIGDYLTKSEATTIYQPKGNYQPAGDYALKSELPDLTPYITSAAADNKYQPKGNYQPAGDYATKQEIDEEIQARQSGDENLQTQVDNKQDTLIPGDGISISEDNVITATANVGVDLIAGSNVTMETTSDGVIIDAVIPVIPDSLPLVPGAGISLTKGANSVTISSTVNSVPPVEYGEHNQFLGIKRTGAYGTKAMGWYDLPDQIPDYQTTDAGKVLKVAVSGDLEWSNNALPSESWYVAEMIPITYTVVSPVSDKQYLHTNTISLQPGDRVEYCITVGMKVDGNGTLVINASDMVDNYPSHGNTTVQYPFEEGWHTANMTQIYQPDFGASPTDNKEYFLEIGSVYGTDVEVDMSQSYVEGYYKVWRQVP